MIRSPKERTSENIPETSESKSIHKNSDRVRYMNGDALSRPLEMPKKYKRTAILLVLLAVVIGAVAFGFYYDRVYNEPVREKALMEQRLSEKVNLDLPDLSALIPLDDAQIVEYLNAQGDTIYERSAATNSSTLDVIKLPEGVSLIDAGAMYLKGINKLSSSEAALLLNGSWNLDVDRTKGMNMSIHYADFSSGTLSSAIQYALEAENLDETELLESGQDESGNTYASGNITTNGSTYAWKISAIPLSDIYSINGLPEDAVYVGIRITS